MDVRELYRKLPLIHHSNYPETAQDRMRFLFGALENFRQRMGKEPHEMHILDVGCGVGRLAFPLAHVGYSVYAIDASPASIEYIKEKNPYLNLTSAVFDLNEGDYRQLPGPFDAILVAGILEHLISPEEALRQLLVNAAPHCLLVGDIPNSKGVTEKVHDVRKWTSKRWGKTKPYRAFARALHTKKSFDATDSASLSDTPHIFPFTYDNFRNLCHQLDLKNLHMEPISFLTGTPVVHKVLMMSVPAIQRMDIELGRRLPMHWASAWYFSAQYDKNEETPSEVNTSVEADNESNAE